MKGDSIFFFSRVYFSLLRKRWNGCGFWHEDCPVPRLSLSKAKQEKSRLRQAFKSLVQRHPGKRQEQRHQDPNPRMRGNGPVRW